MMCMYVVLKLAQTFITCVSGNPLTMRHIYFLLLAMLNSMVGSRSLFKCHYKQLVT